MRWPKEEGTDFAGHEMAKGHEASLAIRWPKRATPLHGQRGGSAGIFFPHLPPLPFWSGGRGFLSRFSEILFAI
jgi:hypothetical protein